jgi:phenylalanyl-tRNA synthetase beta subunit
MTYSLQKKGVAEIANPLANDKSHVRKNLSRGLFAALEHNAQYIDLLALTDIRIFEIGHAVTKEGERRVLGMGVYQRGGKAAPQSVLNEAQQRLEEVLGCSISNHQLSADVSGGMAVAEYDFDALLKTLPQPSEYRQTESTHAKITFQPLSPYPFVLRDIAVWVPQSTNSGELLSVIRDAAGALLTNWRLFDTYERGEYVSYAFRLVFLSYEQTLSDEEVNEVMDRVHAAVDERGWHVR